MGLMELVPPINRLLASSHSSHRNIPAFAGTVPTGVSAALERIERRFFAFAGAFFRDVSAKFGDVWPELRTSAEI